VDRMKQEEEMRIGMGTLDYMRSNELEQVVEEEEDYCEEELNQKTVSGNEFDSQESAKRDMDQAVKTSGHARSISASSFSSVSSTGSVRTAKAERRQKEKLGKEVNGCFCCFGRVHFMAVVHVSFINGFFPLRVFFLQLTLLAPT